MTLHEDHSHTIAKVEWQTNAKHIADWQIRCMVNRTDQGTYWTHKGWCASPGDVASRLRENCQRLAPTVVYSHNAEGRCKWVCLDFDNHESDPDVAQRNLNIATGILNTLTELGVIHLLEDSDGQGGLHLWVLLDPSSEIEAAYRFAKFLRSDYPNDDIETNPKQRSAKSFGNGVRLPGHHHKRQHVSRFWGDAAWLDAQESIELMLNLPTNDTDVLGIMGDFDPDRKPDPPPKAYRHRPASGNGGSVTQAEAHIESIPWPDLLRDFGWHGQGKFWTRPDKDFGISATLGHNGNDLLHVFSVAAGLPVPDLGDRNGASFGKWRFWLHQAGFTDSTQREAAEHYLRGVKS
jgi:hypothetical protein